MLDPSRKVYSTVTTIGLVFMMHLLGAICCAARPASIVNVSIPATCRCRVSQQFFKRAQALIRSAPGYTCSCLSHRGPLMWTEM